MFIKQVTGNSLIKRTGFVSLIIVYLAGGINHFLNPELYIPLIPPYLIYLRPINTISGILEVILAIGLIYREYRRSSALGIVVLLVLFVPAHVFFIQKNSCITPVMCFPAWVAWVRLLFVHPLLMWWAYSYRNYGTN